MSKNSSALKLVPEKESKQDAILRLWSQYIEASKDVRAAEKQRDSAKQALLTAIPAGREIAGITHVVSERKSVSYKSAMSKIIENVVPKTKQEAATSIVAEFTEITQVHSLKSAEEIA